jgi:HD-like signal output (HDOD) protein
MDSPNELLQKNRGSGPIRPNIDEIQSLYSQQEFYIYQDAIEKMQSNEDQLPSLPTITLEIRNATSNPNISATHLSTLIAKDPSLTAILMKHASSAFYRTADKPKNLHDVIGRLGMRTVENITLIHSIKSLFVLRDHQLKNLYKQALRRQTLKASMSYYLAKVIHLPGAEDILIASLLSEVGTLTLLVALQNHDVPTEQTFKILCQHYSKHLGAILLAKWGMAPIFLDVLRKTGEWTLDTGRRMQLVDVINLALFHSVHQLNPNNDLIALQSLSAFKKLAPQYSKVTKENKLSIIEDNMEEINELVKYFS